MSYVIPNCSYCNKASDFTFKDSLGSYLHLCRSCNGGKDQSDMIFKELMDILYQYIEEYGTATLYVTGIRKSLEVVQKYVRNPEIINYKAK